MSIFEKYYLKKLVNSDVFRNIYNILEEYEEFVLNEDAADPVEFEDEPGEKYYPIINLPVMFDEYDIAYLYQFHPNNWSKALHYRYNEALYNEKKKIKGEIHDVKLGSVTYKNINTFAQVLLDKIERQINYEYFSSHRTGDFKDYIEKRKELLGKGEDTYGVMGTSFEDPVLEGDIVFARGYRGPTLVSVKNNIDKWLSGVNNNLLGSVEEEFGEENISHSLEVDDKTKTRSISYKFTNNYLENVKSNMISLGVPENSVFQTTDGNYPIFWMVNGNRKLITSFLPVLKTGMAVYTSSIKELEENKERINSLYSQKNEDEESLKEKILKYLKLSEEKINQEISELNRDLNLSKSKKQQKSISQEISFLEIMKDFSKWTNVLLRNLSAKEQRSVSLEDINIRKMVNLFVKNYISKITKEVGKSEGNKLDIYEFLKHEFGSINSDELDPLNVGMENPAVFKSAPSSIRNRVSVIGGMYPIKSSQTRIVGKQGEWERLKRKFGKGIPQEYKSGNIEYFVDPMFSEEERETAFKEFKEKVYEYIRKMKEVIFNDEESMRFFNNDKNNLKSMDVLKDYINRKADNIIKGNENILHYDENVIPKKVVIYYNQYNILYKNVSKIEKMLREKKDEKEVNITSYISTGVGRAINSQLKSQFDIEAFKEYYNIIIINCEKYIKQMVGHPRFTEFVRSQGIYEKFKRGRELISFIEKASAMYVRCVHQLAFDQTTRKLRSKQTSGTTYIKDEEGDYTQMQITVDDVVKSHEYEDVDTDADDKESSDFLRDEKARDIRNVHASKLREIESLSNKASEVAISKIKSGSTQSLKDGIVDKSDMELAGKITKSITKGKLIYGYFFKLFSEKYKSKTKEEIDRMAKSAYNRVKNSIDMKDLESEAGERDIKDIKSRYQDRIKKLERRTKEKVFSREEFISKVKNDKMNEDETMALNIIYRLIGGRHRNPLEDNDFIMDLENYTYDNIVNKDVFDNVIKLRDQGNKSAKMAYFFFAMQ